MRLCAAQQQQWDSSAAVGFPWVDHDSPDSVLTFGPLSSCQPLPAAGYVIWQLPGSWQQLFTCVAYPQQALQVPAHRVRANTSTVASTDQTDQSLS